MRGDSCITLPASLVESSNAGSIAGKEFPPTFGGLGRICTEGLPLRGGRVTKRPAADDLFSTSGGGAAR